jgi:16S rRNA (uracil1498-N3)-methyltransferase
MARRYFVDPLPAPGPATLRGEVAHHLATVLRVRAGERLVLGDGHGRQSEAEVLRVQARAVAVTVAPSAAVPPLPLRLHLAFAPPRLLRAEWLFEHGTEVGVAVFRPLLTERTRPQAGRIDRWRKLVRAAAGQCDRAHLPEVHEPCPLAQFLDEPALPPRRLLAAPGAPPPPAVAAGELVLLVGPEGGFAEAEQQLVSARGFAPVGLGPLVLRTETAAVVGAALLLVRAGRPDPPAPG